MKISLNHFLLAGLFSSQIFLVNCDNGSHKTVKAMMPTQKSTSITMPPCNDKVMSLIDDRQKIIDNINKTIADAANHDLTSDQKKQLTQYADDLTKKSNGVYDEIRAIKSGGTKAEGCNSATKDGKKATYSIESMRKENLKIGQQISALTKESNSLLTTPSETISSSISKGQVYTLSEDLAAAMRKESINAMYIIEGDVHVGSAASEELKTLQKNNDKSFCYLTVGDEEIKAADALKVISLDSESVKDQKFSSSTIYFSVNRNLVTFDCVTQNTSDVSTDVRDVFGDLLIFKGDVSTQTDSNDSK